MMKCKIAQNVGYIFILTFLIAITECSYFTGRSQTIQELCSSNRYIYSVEPGETQQLKLTSGQSLTEINKWYQKSKRKCRKEFKTNNAASHFVLVLSNMSIPSCSEKCNCNYFEISEPGYTERYCGKLQEDIYFESKSDYLSIDIQHGTSMAFEVTFTFMVERNSYIVTGQPREGIHPSGRILETPYFPNTYQSDYIADYVLQATDFSAKVLLMFLDFQIARESFIEISGHNGTHLARVYGNQFRPPIFVSQTNVLNLRFEANNQPGRSGFRAVCFFFKAADVQKNVPFTNCGGMKEGYGGSISIEASKSIDYYDCLWHLAPPAPFFPYSKSYFLSVSILSLESIGPKATLEFREGLNSKAKLVKSIFCGSSNCSNSLSEITVPAANGLYIRFNGHLTANSSVQMVYSTYHGGNCSHKEYVCGERCLPPSLLCDGVPNCPDGSDEKNCTTTSPVTLQGTTESTITISARHGSKGWGVFIVVLSIGIFGLVIVASVACCIVYQYRKVVPSMTEENTRQPQVVSEMSRPPPVVPSPTSLYLERLPTYEDFISCSDRYPPLLYTRAAKRYSEPYNCHSNVLHTTSFCGYDYHSSSDSKSLDSASTGAHVVIDIEDSSQPSCSFTPSSLENVLKKPFCGMKRTRSLDSKLDSFDTCHVHLSITHSISPKSKYNSLPGNLTVKSHNNSDLNVMLETSTPKVQWGRKRYTSCLTCYDSISICSEIMATVKSRCQSDPCKRVNVHYELYQ